MEGRAESRSGRAVVGRGEGREGRGGLAAHAHLHHSAARRSGVLASACSGRYVLKYGSSVCGGDGGGGWWRTAFPPQRRE